MTRCTHCLSTAAVQFRIFIYVHRVIWSNIPELCFVCTAKGVHSVDTSAKREENICIRIKLSVYLLGISRSMFTCNNANYTKGSAGMSSWEGGNEGRFWRNGGIILETEDGRNGWRSGTKKTGAGGREWESQVCTLTVGFCTDPVQYSQSWNVKNSYNICLLVSYGGERGGGNFVSKDRSSITPSIQCAYHQPCWRTFGRQHPPSIMHFVS